MSRLPQHKKSSEELAKLRESLGIPGQPPALDSLAVNAPENISHRSESGLSLSAPIASVSSVSVPGLPVKQVRSLRRSDRHAAKPPEIVLQKDSDSEAPARPVPSGAKLSKPPRAVHSLRKSEQIPLSQIQSPSADSSLPIHRHSPNEILEIRRQEVLAMQKLAVEQGSQKAHWSVVILGYLFAIAAIVGCYYYRLEFYIIVGCLAASFLVAGFLLIRKPYSRHHAAFIGVMSLIVAIFSVLHYYPQLRYGT